MKASLKGKFHNLSKYTDNLQLLRLLRELLINAKTAGDHILRIEIYPYDIEFGGVLYLKGSDVDVVLLKDEEPIVVSNADAHISMLLDSEGGFMEIYYLNENEYLVDMEILTYEYKKTRGGHGNPRISISSESLLGLIDQKLNRRLETTKASVYTGTLGDALSRFVYDEELTRMLDDVTFRAGVLLRRKYDTISVDTGSLPGKITELLSIDEDLIIVIKAKDKSYWIYKSKDNRIGFSVFPTTDGIVGGDAMSVLREYVLKIIPDSHRTVRLFIYHIREE